MKNSWLYSMAFLVSITAFAGPASLKEGKWEITVTMSPPSMPGMPAMAAQTTKQVQCVKKGEGDIKQLMMKEKSCTASDVKSSGSTIEWKMKCDIEGMVTQGKGKVTNKDNSFDGSVETNMTLPQGMSMNTLLKFNGKWLGGC